MQALYLKNYMEIDMNTHKLTKRISALGLMTITSACLTLSLPSFASSLNQSLLATDAAANAMDVSKLKQLSQENTLEYATAYSHYRLAIAANILGQRSSASQALEQAQTLLEQALINDKQAETLALLANVYGMQISFDTSKGATLGMKIGQLLEQAKALDPSNPRVALVQAISAFNTPSLFGGGMDKAIRLSTQAIQYYGQPCNDICWGETEAYTWRGLAKQEYGDITGAIEDWQLAVSLDADYAWAKFLLSQHQQAANP
jgi:tetratricopeptide (TPR) repeat protein